MKNKYVFVFLMCGVCLLTMLSCFSIQNLKYKKTPNEYEISIYEKVLPYGYIDGYMAKSLYLIDSNLMMYGVKIVHKRKTSYLDTVFLGKKLVSNSDLREIKKIEKVLWNDLDTMYSSFMLDGFIIFIDLKIGTKEKRITIKNSKTPNLNELYAILNKYGEEFHVYFKQF